MTQARPDNGKSRNFRDAAVALAIAVVVGLTAYFSWSGEVFERIAAIVAWLQGVVDANFWASLVGFFAACVILSSLCFPVKPAIGISAGLLFGFAIGMAVVLVALSIGSTVAFLGSRYLLREWAERRLGSRLARFREGFDRHNAAYLLMIRFNPFIPYWLVNLVVGLTDMKLRTYVPLTVIGLVPATLLYVTTGSQIETIAHAGGPSLSLLAALLALSLVPVAPVVARHLARRRARN